MRQGLLPELGDLLLRHRHRVRVFEVGDFRLDFVVEIGYFLHRLLFVDDLRDPMQIVAAQLRLEYFQLTRHI